LKLSINNNSTVPLWYYCLYEIIFSWHRWKLRLS